MECIPAPVGFAQNAFWAAGAVAFVIATIGGIAAWPKYWRELKAREWDRALELYKRFLDVAIAHPEFTPGYWTASAPGSKERNKFRWYMAHFLWAAEQALLRVPEQRDEWEKVVRVMLREHADFLASPEAQEEVGCYYGRLKTLIDETIEQARAANFTRP